MKTRALLFVALTAALAGVSHSSNAETAYPPREKCARKITSLTNPRLMSNATALRKTRVLCDEIQRDDRYLFKALTQ